MASEGTKLYVGNIPWSTTKESLMDAFGQYGQVQDAFIPTDRETGRPRGFAFVTMAPQAAAAAQQALNNTDFHGRTIRVNEASPPGEGGRPRGGGGGGYGGGRGGYGGGQGGYGQGGYGGGQGGYGQGGYGGGYAQGGYGGAPQYGGY